MEQKEFAVFDVDGTLGRRQLYHEFVIELALAGALGTDAPGLFADARQTWERRGSSPDAFGEYDDVLVSTYEKALPDISPDLHDRLADKVIAANRDQSYSYTTQRLEELKAAGRKLFIVSGSHTELIAQIGGYYGFDDWEGTEYERGTNGFTGGVTTSTLNKATSLQRLLDRHPEVTLRGSMGFGDTGSDIAMLAMVEHPVAFNPDEKLLEAAQQHGWPIVIERKNVIYTLKSNGGNYVLAETSPE
jgi:HAD superfamily phosphoserine phosphatase-like hydrolase